MFVVVLGSIVQKPAEEVMQNSVKSLRQRVVYQQQYNSSAPVVHLQQPMPSVGDITRLKDAMNLPDFPELRSTNYMQTPGKFVHTVQECEQDDNCRVIMHHAYKTGGK